MRLPHKLFTAAILIILFSVLLAASAISKDREKTEPQLSMEHQINVPAAYSSGQVSPHFPSDIDRYISAYDSAWWQCVENYSKNIHYKSTADDKAGNGHPPAIIGWKDGYLAAEKRIKYLISQFGDVKVQEFLKESLEFPK